MAKHESSEFVLDHPFILEMDSIRPGVQLIYPRCLLSWLNMLSGGPIYLWVIMWAASYSFALLGSAFNQMLLTKRMCNSSFGILKKNYIAVWWGANTVVPSVSSS